MSAELLELLRPAELLAGLDEAALSALAASTTKLELAEGAVVVREGEAGDELFVVGSGELAVLVGGHELARVHAGQMFGEMQLIAGGLRTATVIARSGCVLGRIGRAGLDAAAERAPALMERITESVARRLRLNAIRTRVPQAIGSSSPELLAAIEARATWVHVSAGAPVFRQGEPADAWYVVASGRVRVVREGPHGDAQVLSEVGRGESLGELALLAELPRTATPYAIRDTTLLRLSAADFHEMLAKDPAVVRAVMRTVATRALSTTTKPARDLSARTIAVVPLSGQAADFTARLESALHKVGATLCLSPERLAWRGALFAASRDSDPAWLRFSLWLDERAETHRFIVLACDVASSAWTRRSLREADHVIFVADAREDPTLAGRERELTASFEAREHATRTLVLLHPEGTRQPSGTARFLAAGSFDAHQHVRADRPGDVDRVARLLAGETVSLVLGAGGARGFAHVGTYRAMLEAKVPIDSIGGTSSGSMIGAMIGMDLTPDEIMGLTRRMVAFSPFDEWVFPISSLLGGLRLEQAVMSAFGDLHMEDLWVPFFCTSCDISRYVDVVHDRGPIVPAVLASSALPGVLPPRILDGNMHVDGGATHGLPGAVMRERSRGPMIAVDVSSERELKVPALRYPGGLRALWRRLRKLDDPPPPTIAQLFMRAVSVGTATSTEAVARDAELFLRPPVERYGTTQLEHMEAIERIGYAYAKERLAGWRR